MPVKIFYIDAAKYKTMVVYLIVFVKLIFMPVKKSENEKEKEKKMPVKKVMIW